MPLRNVRPKQTQAIIANGGTTSTQVNLRDGSYHYASGNITIPDLTSTNTFKYQVTADGTNWVDLRSAALSTTGYTGLDGSTGMTAPLPVEIFSFLAFRVVASGAQGAEMIFTVHLV